jgi:hypothetical protein
MTQKAPTSAPPSTDADPQEQVNFRTEGSRKRAFYEYCETHGVVATRVFETFMDTFTASDGLHSVRHLDGSVCPISGLVDMLATTARAELNRRLNR